MAFFADRLGVTTEFLATGIPDGVEDNLRYRLEEARRAARESDIDRAERHVSSVIGLSEEYGFTRLRAQALALQGEVRILQGRVRDAVDLYEEALETDLPERERGRVVVALARAYRAVGDLTYASELVESFLAEGKGLPLDPGLATEMQTVLISIYFERGDVLRAERAASRALASAGEETPPEVRANTYWAASRVLAEARRWDEALELATRARVIMEELDDHRRVAQLHNAYAFICLEADPPRTEEAASHLERAEALLEGSSAPADLAYVLTERSRLSLLEERPEEALAHAERALEGVGTDSLEAARCLFLKGRALGVLGRPAEAGESLQEAAQLFGVLGARQQEAACWRELGELHLAGGDVDAAVKALRAGLEALDPRRSRA
jgi:tetratricopeptide (TPR) repeat protein